MVKLLGLLFLLGIGWLVVKRILGPEPAAREKSQPRFEKTVRCARCGVHLPLSLARAGDNGHVCSDPDCSGRRGPDTEPDHRE